MYIDVIVLVVLILLVFIFFRNFSSVVYGIFIIDLVLRALTYVKWNIGLPDVKNVINNYIPESIPAIIGKYLNGVAYTIVIWVYIAFLFVFIGYLIRTFVKKRRK